MKNKTLIYLLLISAAYFGWCLFFHYLAADGAVFFDIVGGVIYVWTAWWIAAED